MLMSIISPYRLILLGLQASLGFQVVITVAFNCEPFAAYGTAKGLQVQVSSQVDLEIAVMLRKLVADPTLEQAHVDDVVLDIVLA